jgi:hypothetical protein
MARTSSWPVERDEHERRSEALVLAAMRAGVRIMYKIASVHHDRVRAGVTIVICDEVARRRDTRDPVARRNPLASLEVLSREPVV